jgi:hypothetical protein
LIFCSFIARTLTVVDRTPEEEDLVDRTEEEEPIAVDDRACAEENIFFLFLRVFLSTKRSA